MKLIVDVDTGMDDAQALMMALSYPGADVLAVTCVAGNTNVDQACTNTLRVLDKWRCTKVPVYKGARSSLIGCTSNSAYHHGSDGMGGVHENAPPPNNEPLKTDEPAAVAITRLVHQFPNEVALVALGPLTNLALALHLDPEIGQKLSKLVIMGGSLKARGNCRIGTCCEFNFGSDPEAAMFVLENIHARTLLVPWDTCWEDGISWDETDDIMNIETEKGRFHESINRAAVARRKTMSDYYLTCDPCAMMVALDESVILDSCQQFVTVEISGKHTRGQSVVDWNKTHGKPANVIIVNKLKMDVLADVFRKMLNE